MGGMTGKAMLAATGDTSGMEVVVVVVHDEHAMEVPIGKMGTWVRDVDGMLTDSPNWSNSGNNVTSQSCPGGMRVLRVIKHQGANPQRAAPLAVSMCYMQCTYACAMDITRLIPSCDSK